MRQVALALGAVHRRRPRGAGELFLGAGAGTLVAGRFYGGLAVFWPAVPALRPPRRWCLAIVAAWAGVGFLALLITDDGRNWIAHFSRSGTARPSSCTSLRGHDALRRRQFASPTSAPVESPHASGPRRDPLGRGRAEPFGPSTITHVAGASSAAFGRRIYVRR